MGVLHDFAYIELTLNVCFCLVFCLLLPCVMLIILKNRVFLGKMRGVAEKKRMKMMLFGRKVVTLHPLFGLSVRRAPIVCGGCGRRMQETNAVNGSCA